ncbi:NADP-dependent oxidoreductase domain-containing protein [Gautieria morchelliformis]|nr:NADP-dependent oxidoreductase domain-containing protein [Gautieria morchelliformis]
MSQVPSIQLNNGVLIPAIGLGCWAGHTPEQREAGQHWMVTALKNGYRHFDTAHVYGTEHVVGNAIRESGIPREEVFVTTKLPSHHHGRVKESLEESLKRFGFDYFDLYLVHWPQAFVWKGRVSSIARVQCDPFRTDDNPSPRDKDGNHEVVEHPNLNETWAAMEGVLATGKVKAIGVSNFSVKTLTQLLQTANVIPAVNQVEMHPYLSQHELRAFANTKGIVLTAYTPTGHASVREDPAVVAIANKHGVSSAQVSLAWHLSRGTAAVPKSASSEHQVQNINLPVLDNDDILRLDSLDKNTHLLGYYGCPNSLVFGWTYEQLGW